MSGGRDWASDSKYVKLTLEPWLLPERERETAQNLK